jgi:4-amino-4-deoxy-L-arabinose transferase-like glycosyltransferase
MRRIFSNPLLPLAAGLCLRFFFVLKYPAGSGDTVLYDQIATNWLKHHVYAMNVAGAITPVDIRVPGYPAFLAIIYWLSGKTGQNARFWVMTAQVGVDLLTCLVIAQLAAVLNVLPFDGGGSRRTFSVALWLAALCPFTANYVAVPLTETLAIFFTALALLLLCVLFLKLREPQRSVAPARWLMRVNAEHIGALAGFAAGLGTLVRPETPLLLIVALGVLGFCLLRKKQWRVMLRLAAFIGIGCVLPLLPWAIRNAITLHEIQFLAPKNSNLPGELVPYGFMAWEKTWLFRIRDAYLVSWKLNDESINPDDIPPGAFDTPDERERVAALLEPYNEDLTLTPEEDAGFGQLAKERTARHPLRTYLWLPVGRAFTLWFSPRIELLPLSGKAFPLAEAWEDDPVDQSVTIFFTLLTVCYLALAAWGAKRLWCQEAAHTAVALLLTFLILRTVFLATLETPEPRYVLECFPGILALVAQVFAGRRASTELPVQQQIKPHPMEA